jgi:hypothetical protein
MGQGQPAEKNAGQKQQNRFFPSHIVVPPNLVVPISKTSNQIKQERNAYRNVLGSGVVR